MKPDEPRSPDAAAWARIRERYEHTAEHVGVIAQSIGMTQLGLSLHAKAEGWKLRRPDPKPKRSAKAKTTASDSATIGRLRAMLQVQIADLEPKLKVTKDKTSIRTEKTIRAMNTLVRTLEKLLDIEKHDREQGSEPDFRMRRLDEAEREALADKIERLQRSWRSEKVSVGAGPERGGEPQ